MDKTTALSELEKARGQITDIFNTAISKINDLIIRIENGEPIDEETSADIETLYPLSVSPSLFKGTKPTAIFFGDEKAPVKTWRNVYTFILQRCAGIPEKREMLISLCNKISGRTRVILSDKPDGMDFPIKITDGVFVEGDFDTEWLIRILTTEILDVVRYDYSGISVSVVKNKRKGCRQYEM